jgi:nucleoside-diphosphate-sugar epimerase
MRAQSLKFYGDGAVRCAFTDLNDVGRVTACVLQDKATENKFVFAYGQELTQREVWEIAKEFSPDGEELEGRKILVSICAVHDCATIE